MEAAGLTFAGLCGTLGILGAIIDTVDGSNTATRDPSATASEAPAKVDAKPAPVKKPSPSTKPPVKQATPPKPKVVEYPDGDYVVGEDIPAVSSHAADDPG